VFIVKDDLRRRILNNSGQEASSNKNRQHVLGVHVLWAVIVLSSLVWSCVSIRSNTYSNARLEAIATHNKDIAYRRWAASHGGVYVPVSENTPPSPYLQHIPDRDITTTTGKKLTLINPAYMTRQVHEIGTGEYGVRGHITSLNPIRPGNAPDMWERKALIKIETTRQEISGIELIDGEKFMRVMHPMIAEQRCLKCHAKQGYKVGDLRGGISVSVPMDRYMASLNSSILSISLWHGLIWALGAASIIYACRVINSRIDERDRSEKDREKLLKSLSAKNKELQSIVYVASHDLKSPLVNIAGFSSELGKECDELEKLINEIEVDADKKGKVENIINENIPESLRFIKAGTTKMFTLLEGLLNISRIGTAETDIRHLDANKIIRYVRDTIEFQVKETNTEIIIDKLPGCLGDEEMVNQMFSNILGNAIKYLDPARKGKIHIHGKIENGMSIYCFQDNGIGIAEQHLDKIFEVFHRLDPQSHEAGEGLGLSIVQRIVDKLDGQISVESKPGEGSTFSVSLPKG
jgi:signal transduction histidine kinase